jgi:hypothetical protein
LNQIIKFPTIKLLCACHHETNTKLITHSNQSVIPAPSQLERQKDAILYKHGGRTVFGSTTPRISFLGRTEGQPGGLIGPVKNRF